jgi:putative redox protein
MGALVSVELKQIGVSTVESEIRTHKVLLDRPLARGGADQGPMAGELFLTGVGGCFMSNLLAAISESEADIKEVKITVTGEIVGDPLRFVSMNMDISAYYSDRELIEKLVLLSEERCVCANTIKNEVKLSFNIA